ncbi:MAG: hypothetical protein JWO38_5117 [Gemmataceae bacterium]|nr:hypothetical protein [Gemmataceae bacterium]
MIEQMMTEPGNVLEFKVTGKLHDADYKTFVPAVEEAIKAGGKVRILARFADFHGWDAPALWDDIKFAAHHYSDVERIALVGDKTWEKWMAAVCKPFTKAVVKYFDASELEAARAWVRGPA